MSGTDIGYQVGVLRLAAGTSLSEGVSAASCLRACYVKRGAELAYGTYRPTRVQLAVSVKETTWGADVITLSAYGLARPCPVLT
eukprot:3936491-Rhodomonas_salina.3